MKKEKQVLILYLIFVFAVSVPIEVLWILKGESASGLSLLLMLVPAVVALVLKMIFFRKQPLLGLCLGKPVYYVWAVVLPLAYIGLSYGLYWIFVPGSFTGTSVLTDAIAQAVNIPNLPAAIGITLLITVLANVPMTFGEEAGWRGLMYPIMDTLWGRNKALIISGAIWAGWHLPVMIGGVYMSGASLFFRIPLFILCLMAVTVVASWLRVKSGSVWPAVLWHIMHNMLDQAVFTPMTRDVNSAYFVSETGIITTLFAVIIAVLILRRF